MAASCGSRGRRDGLRPWSPLKVYMGGVRADESWTVPIDSGEYNPVLGDSYANIASFGLSFQRSQNGGRYAPSVGPIYQYYTRTASRVAAPDKENLIFDGTGVGRAISTRRRVNYSRSSSLTRRRPRSGCDGELSSAHGAQATPAGRRPTPAP